MQDNPTENLILLKIFYIYKIILSIFYFEIIIPQHSTIHCYLNIHFLQITIIKIQHNPKHEAAPNFHVLLCLMSNTTISL